MQPENRRISSARGRVQVCLRRMCLIGVLVPTFGVGGIAATTSPVIAADSAGGPVLIGLALAAGQGSTETTQGPCGITPCRETVQEGPCGAKPCPTSAREGPCGAKPCPTSVGEGPCGANPCRSSIEEGPCGAQPCRPPGELEPGSSPPPTALRVGGSAAGPYASDADPSGAGGAEARRGSDHAAPRTERARAQARQWPILATLAALAVITLGLWRRRMSRGAGNGGSGQGSTRHL